MSEIWAQLKPQLEMFSKPFPQAAIDLANAHRDEVAPYLIACLEAIASDPAPTQDPDYMLPLYAMHLLASWRDTRAYRPLVKLGHFPDDVIEQIMGDSVTESYGRALASVCDGDMRPLEVLVEDVGAGIWARHAALTAMTVRALEGDADRESVIAFFATRGEREVLRLRTLADNAEDFELIDGIVSNATDIGAVSMLPAIRQWFADKLLDETIAGERWVAAHIVLSPEDCLARLRSDNNSYLSDAAREMSWWYCFREEKAPATPKPGNAMLKEVVDRNSAIAKPPYQGFAAKPATIVRDAPKIGRNDPCHCGSGRKFKKCHGASI